MVETIAYTPIYSEDIDFGVSTRQIRMQDNSLQDLKQFDPGWELVYLTGDLAPLLGLGRTIVCDRITAVTAPLTLPVGDTLVFTRGGQLSFTGSGSLTVLGTLQAGEQQIFDTNAVTFPGGADVRGAWWGAAPGVESAAAINMAMQAGTVGMHISLGDGTYLLEDSIVFPNNTDLDYWLVGQGNRRTVLQRAPGFAGALITLGESSGLTCTRWQIRDMELDGVDNATFSTGIRMIRTARSHIQNVRFLRLALGLHASGGSYLSFDQCWFGNCTMGTQIDNEFQGATIYHFTHTQWQNNTAEGVLIDGDVGSTQVRSINFSHCSFENTALTGTGDIGVRINLASQIHFTSCWHEANDQHVQVDGDENQRQTFFLTWTDCQFGSLRGASTTALEMNGTGSPDGVGSYMKGCVLAAGIFTFNQTFLCALLDTHLTGTAAVAGTQWYRQTTGTLAARNYFQHTTNSNWQIEQLNRLDPAYTSRAWEIYAVASTTDATPTDVGIFATTTNASLYVDAHILAKVGNGTEQAGYHIAGLFRNNAGALALIGAVQSLHPAIESAGAAAWDVTMAALGASLRIRVTGAAVATVRWNIVYTVVQTVDI